MIKLVKKFGKFVTTRRGNEVIRLANKIKELLEPYSNRIKIAGSISRKVKDPIDIDIVLIPKSKDLSKIREIIEKAHGKYISGGSKRMTFRIYGVKLELYFIDSKSFGACVLSYTGPKGSSIGLRKVAKSKGYLLNQYGLFKRGRLIEGNDEKRIHSILGVKWKKPEKRGE